MQCDVTDNDSVTQAIATTVERNGPLHLAVNSAYQAMVGSVLATPPDLFAMTVEATLTGTYRSLQAEARAIRESGGGSIVNISSLAATHVSRWQSAYGAAKAGVDMLTRVAARRTRASRHPGERSPSWTHHDRNSFTSDRR